MTKFDVFEKIKEFDEKVKNKDFKKSLLNKYYKDIAHLYQEGAKKVEVFAGVGEWNEFYLEFIFIYSKDNIEVVSFNYQYLLFNYLVEEAKKEGIKYIPNLNQITFEAWDKTKFKNVPSVKKVIHM